MLTDSKMPTEESEFFEALRIYFPNIYDVKYLMKSCKNLKGGLQEVAEQLEVGLFNNYWNNILLNLFKGKYPIFEPFKMANITLK